MNVRNSFLMLAAAALLLFSCSGAARSQAREHLTPEEVELIQDAQILDKRIDVFIKAADRRVLALNTGSAADAKQVKKDSEKWGPLPTGTRSELVGDVARILDEAITNIDDVSMRDEKNPLIAKSLRKLAAAATRLVEQLKPAQTQMSAGSEGNSFDLLTENAESIVQAAAKLPPPSEKKKSKTEKSKETN
ncbi:MAG TPA: hypothetical protein VGW36_03820 [Pyrinomonadaceae bacterium]|nr:hypothetical protein [Pyrinomonadaceae bacterium]